jgi:hypothetical protein
MLQLSHVIELSPNCGLCSTYIAQYGCVLRTRAGSKALPKHEQAWLKTHMSGDIDIDGNPGLPQNGGIVNLARRHCAASLMNHSFIARHRNAKFTELHLHISTDLEWFGMQFTKGAIIGIIVLEATRDIESYEQILGDYMNGKDKIIDPMDYLSF